MATLNGKKVYYPDFDNENDLVMGLNKVALTKTPATHGMFIALSKQKAVEIHLDNDKQILYGPLLIPGQPIERYTKELGSFYIIFTKEVIEKIARNLFNKVITLNYEHIKDKPVQGRLQEIWLTGIPDKSNAWGFDPKEGTLFGGVKIDSREFWLSEVKTKNVLGFSIEAITDLIDIKMEKLKLAEIETVDGIKIKTDAEQFDKGVDVYTEDETGAKTPLSDGEYDLGNGMRMIVVDGKVADIVQLSAEEIEAKQTEIAMKALFAPLLKPYEDKIAALETKLSAVEVELANIPGELKKKKEQEPVKLSATELVMKALEKQKEKQKSNSKK